MKKNVNFGWADPLITDPAIVTVVLPSPIDQIWTDFEGKKSSGGRNFFLVRATAETKIVLKHKLPSTDYRRCTR